jgi:hypothetical protein
MNFRVIKFVPYGDNEPIKEFKTYHGATQYIRKNLLLTAQDIVEGCDIVIEGKINNEWYALV